MHRGTISVQTENIFPIIKKFLYSEQEVFLRELIANAVDATNKLQTLSRKGENVGQTDDLRIEIHLNKEAKTLTISDRGIGMSTDEMNKYLNQVAFSSAAEWLEKYKNETNIIGHFGLGFYSAFMVATQVEVISKSWRADQPAARWTCDGSPEYTIEATERAERGTDIILHLSDDASDYLEKHRIQQLLDKYCKFLPIPIEFGTKTDHYQETLDQTDENGEPKTEWKTREIPNIINNTNPLWKRQPTDLTEADYLAFYQELYPYSQPPMFWIHLNIDYPFDLTGVLYFPRMANNIEVQKNKIQLYCNQVYVTDDVKEIVPEFLTLLHGVIDSPDIPLNVSRSYLQADANVRKITQYITRKVADKLDELFRKERPDFEKKWENIGLFVKYGMVTDDTFYEKAKKFALLTNIEGTNATLDEYLERIKPLQTDKNNKVAALYTHDPAAHHTYTEAAKAQGYDILKTDPLIDNHFIQKIEHTHPDLIFKRVDADTPQQLIEKDTNPESILSSDEQNTIQELFKQATTGNNAPRIELKPLSPDDMPVLITRPEWMRRMKEMQMFQNAGSLDLPDHYTLVVNTNHPTIAQHLLQQPHDQRQQTAQYLYHLACLQQGLLKGAELTQFVRQAIARL